MARRMAVGSSNRWLLPFCRRRRCRTRCSPPEARQVEGALEASGFERRTHGLDVPHALRAQRPLPHPGATAGCWWRNAMWCSRPFCGGWPFLFILFYLVGTSHVGAVIFKSPARRPRRQPRRSRPRSGSKRSEARAISHRPLKRPDLSSNLSQRWARPRRTCSRPCVRARRGSWRMSGGGSVASTAGPSCAAHEAVGCPALGLPSGHGSIDWGRPPRRRAGHGNWSNWPCHAM